MALLALVPRAAFAPPLPPSTTIDSANYLAYGANVGWINARGDVTNGAAIGQYYCIGYLYSANCGWIALGNGPTNGVAYANNSADDFGVNHDGTGGLNGYAYGANVGWIGFETNGQPRVDLLTGNLSGYVYGANIGWISLSNAQAHVRTTYLDPGADQDADDLPDAWELTYTNTLAAFAFGSGDQDNDGVSDQDEYLADTDPTNPDDHLYIDELVRLSSSNQVTWTVKPTRFYRLEEADAPTNGAAWVDSGLGLLTPGAAGLITGTVEEASATMKVYRARAIVPLAP